MADRFSQSLATGMQRGLGVLRRPELMVFLPGVTLAAFWLGGERALVLTALSAPMLFALAGAFRTGSDAPVEQGNTGGRTRAIRAIDGHLRAGRDTGKTTACFIVRLDGADLAEARQGSALTEEILTRSADRIQGVLREGDSVLRLDGGIFAVVLAPARRLDLEICIQLSVRVQQALAQPISVEAQRVYVTGSVGFCLAARAPAPNGQALFEAADLAAEEAARHGPGAIRAFDPGMTRRKGDRDTLTAELDVAFDESQIRAHFQPQISTDTGEITGFEALARWYHPVRGMIPPAEFLPAIEEAGLSERLGEAMLYQALSALAVWDKTGARVPAVSVNFSKAELRGPGLAQKLKWELDRFGLAPERLTIEILESVAGETENEVVVANIAAISKLGCGVDLDDFGTGTGSILSLRRFAIRRIKIDRSFVTRVDEDRDQQRVVAAILSMAEQLGLQTLAEGVETPGEHAMLTQLGCDHVQGFGIARPMPVEDTLDWIARHRARLTGAPRIGSRAK
jgi:predicted signal transduction protein with EAL and GGDEF domain